MVSGVGQINLDQLIALNDEMLALSRAGVPLEQGLIDLQSDLPGQLGRVVDRVATRLQAGEGLVDVVSTAGKFPETYAAVVEAGIRSGNLTQALEGIADSARRVQHVRYTYWLGMIYPLLVFSITYCLFLFMLGGFMPSVSDAYKGLEVSNLEWLHWLADFGRGVNAYYILPLIVLIVGFLVQWFRTKSVKESPFTWGGLPTAGYVRRMSQIAVFSETLSLLLEQNVPLEQAVSLAGKSLGKCRLREVAVAMSERLTRGERLQSIDDVPRELPALLGWLILSGQSTHQLKKAVRKTADNYQIRSSSLASWMAIYIPLLMSGLVGGTTVLFYCWLVYGSLASAMYQLAQPVN